MGSEIGLLRQCSSSQEESAFCSPSCPAYLSSWSIVWGESWVPGTVLLSRKFKTGSPLLGILKIDEIPGIILPNKLSSFECDMDRRRSQFKLISQFVLELFVILRVNLLSCFCIQHSVISALTEGSILIGTVAMNNIFTANIMQLIAPILVSLHKANKDQNANQYLCLLANSTTCTVKLAYLHE